MTMVMDGVVWVSLGSRYGGKVVIDGFLCAVLVWEQDDVKYMYLT